MLKKLFILILFLFFACILNLHSQNNRRVLNGKIVSDSLSVNKIHVINKTTKKGTFSNQNGDFTIPVKVNDTIVFSAVQFEAYHRIVIEIDLKQLQVIIKLKPKINLLEEVIIKPVSIAKQLSLPNADKKPLNSVENRLNAHNKSPTPIVALAALLNQRGGIDNLYYLFSGKRREDRKLNKLREQDKIRELNYQTLKKIRLHFKDEFFTKTTSIPLKEINNFLDFCIKDNIVILYNENRILELIEIFLNESKPFLEEIKE